MKHAKNTRGHATKIHECTRAVHTNHDAHGSRLTSHVYTKAKESILTTRSTVCTHKSLARQVLRLM